MKTENEIRITENEMRIIASKLIGKDKKIRELYTFCCSSCHHTINNCENCGMSLIDCNQYALLRTIINALIEYGYEGHGLYHILKENDLIDMNEIDFIEWMDYIEWIKMD